MPIRSKKPCKKIGCSGLATYPNKYCSMHLEIEKQEIAKRNSFYDRNIRDKECDEFYHSDDWIKSREYILKKYKGLDLYVYFILNEIVYADTVHHIEELKENWNRRLDINNLIPMSNPTHKKIHAMYKKDKAKTQNLLFKLIERWRKEMM